MRFLWDGVLFGKGTMARADVCLGKVEYERKVPVANEM